MDVADIYLLRTTFNLNAVQTAVINHYFISTLGFSGTVSENVLDEWISDIVPSFVAMMDENHSIVEYLCINGMNNSDFDERFVNTAGTRTGTMLPTAMCLTIKSGRAGPGYRFSYRHFPFGVASDLDGDTGAWTSGFLGAAASLGVLLGTTLVPATGGNLESCQISPGFKLEVEPTIKQVLAQDWTVEDYPGWLRSRQQRESNLS